MSFRGEASGGVAKCRLFSQADNVVKITVDVYKPAAFILWPITNYDNVLLQFMIAWLLQFLTTVFTFYDIITIHVINGISLKAATSNGLPWEDKQ